LSAQDDSVDWTEGYSGSLTNVYIEHRQTHDKGIEGDGFNTDIGNNSSPIFFSAPTITNLTINGLGSSNENEAVRLRAGTRAVISNVLIEGFAEAFDLDDTETGDGVLTGDTSITDVTFDDVTLNLRNDTEADFEEGDVISGIGNGIGADFFQVFTLSILESAYATSDKVSLFQKNQIPALAPLSYCAFAVSLPWRL